MSACRHLAKGSEKPSMPDDGLLRLYSMRFCPFAQRVHLVLDAKHIPYHCIYINLTSKPDWLFDVNPQGKVPALELDTEQGQLSLTESMIICEYLDEKYPERALYPKDPLKKAQEKILIERLGLLIDTFFKASDGGPLAPFWTVLDNYEQELRIRGTKFYSGEQPGILDYMLWPWCERLELLRVQCGEDYCFDEERFVKLALWLQFMKQDDAVRVFYVDAELQAKFLKTRKAGAPEYDLLVQD